MSKHLIQLSIVLICVSCVESTGAEESPPSTDPIQTFQRGYIELGSDGKPIGDVEVFNARRQYQFEIEHVEQGKVLSSPVIATIEGRTVEFRTGGSFTISRPDGHHEEFYFGPSCKLLLYRADGKLKLDGTFGITELQDHGSDNGHTTAFRATTRSIRVIEDVTLGKKISISFDADDTAGDSGRIDLVITQFDSE